MDEIVRNLIARVRVQKEHDDANRTPMSRRQLRVTREEMDALLRETGDPTVLGYELVIGSPRDGGKGYTVVYD